MDNSIVIRAAEEVYAEYSERDRRSGNSDWSKGYNRGGMAAVEEMLALIVMLQGGDLVSFDE